MITADIEREAEPIQAGGAAVLSSSGDASCITLPDPDLCESCGCSIDGHSRVDTYGGPIFLCDDGPGDLVRQWELADPRDAWRHTGEPPPPSAVRNSDISARPTDKPRPYRTPQATIDAFWYVVRLDDAEHMRTWLAQHPLDAPYLLKLWERKNARA
jgi:hypothetical protein